MPIEASIVPPVLSTGTIHFSTGARNASLVPNLSNKAPTIPSPLNHLPTPDGLCGGGLFDNGNTGGRLSADLSTPWFERIGGTRLLRGSNGVTFKWNMEEI